MSEGRILDKVRKMLNLANDAGASEGERDNALRMAHALLAKHNLDMSQVDMSGGGQGEARGEDHIKVRSKMWMAHVANAVAKLMFCTCYMTKRHDGLELTYIGRISNVTTAKEMTDYLIESIRREGAKFAKGDSRAHLSFNKGATARIVDRCTVLRVDAERASQGASTGTSLVLASVYKTELQANQDYLASKGIRLGKVRGGRQGVTDATAYAAGSQYGNSVSLNRQVKGAGNAPRLN